MMNESIDDFFIATEFSETIVYTPEGGEATNIKAVVNTNFPRQESYERGYKFAVAELSVHKTEVTAPAGGDRYTFRNKTWQVAGDGYQESGSFYRVNLVRILT